MIKLKCDYISGAVAVPTDIIDKHLKLAPAASFKVLLFILRNSDSTVNSQQISAGTGLPLPDVNQCLAYWEGHGAIEVTPEEDGESYKKALGNAKALESVAERVPDEKEKLKVKSLPVKKPTQREVALRITQDSSIGELFKEAQCILGTFGYDTQSILLMIYDYYGMSPEVILTLLQYQKNENKTSSAAIKARAEDWAKKGIESLADVDKELLSLEKIASAYSFLKDDLGSTGENPTPRVHKFLRDWAVEWDCSNELIKYALQETKGVYGDTNKLLKKLSRQGVKTPAEAMEKEKKALPKTVQKSYDIENVGKSSVLDWAKRFSDKEENI